MKGNLKRKKFGISLLVAVMLLAASICLGVVETKAEEDNILANTDGLKVEFLGGSLRMDYAEDYKNTCIRFGYQFTLPESKKMEDYTWKWEYTMDGKDIATTTPSERTGEKYVAVEGVANTYQSNLVITGVPDNYYERTFYVKLIVTDEDGTVLTNDNVMSRTIKYVSDQIAANSSVAEQVTYANGIITEDEAHDTKVDDVIFRNFNDAVNYASTASISANTQKTVVVRDNIALTEATNIPTGANVAIKDDGTARTLTRSAEYYTDAPLFNVYGGASFILTSSQPNQDLLDDERNINTINDMLIIDGNKSAVTTEGYSSIVDMLDTTDGSTANTSETGAKVIVDSGVALKNNATNEFGAAILMRSNGYGQLTINGGRFEGNTSGDARGGVILVNANNSADVLNALFTDNSANSAGVLALGATATEGAGASAEIDGCVFSNNTATNNSGVLTSYATEKDALIINNSNFSGNSAPQNGAIYVKGTLKMENCNFTGNSATSKYAGVMFFSNDSAATISNCKFTNNSCKTLGGVASATTGSNIKFDKCTFTGNTGVSYGAVYADYYVSSTSTSNSGGATVSFTDSTFTSNTTSSTSSGVGGAVSLMAPTILTVSGCTFSGNTSNKFGGAIGAGGSTAVACDIKIEDSTFTGNGNASVNGGAVFVCKSGTLTLSGTNTFSGNTSSSEETTADCSLSGYAETLNISGKLQSMIYVSIKAVSLNVNITGALEEGSNVTFGYASNSTVLAGTKEAMTFANADVMAASTPYINLYNSSYKFDVTDTSTPLVYYATKK